MKKLFAVAALGLLLTAGCGKPAPPPSGAVNAVDAGINENLIFAHAALANHEADLATGKRVASASEKKIVNDLVKALNLADALYCNAPAADQPCAPGSYHAVLKLNPMAGEPAELTAALSTVAANLASIEALVKGGK